MSGHPKTNEEMIAGIRRQIKALEARARDEDPWVMAEMLGLAGELEDAATRTVGALRKAGYTWHDIGFELGLSRQATFNRFKHKIGKREVKR